MGAARHYVCIKGEKGVIKMQMHTNRIGGLVSCHGNFRTSFFLIEYLVRKLFTIITRFSDGFVIPESIRKMPEKCLRMSCFFSKAAVRQSATLQKSCFYEYLSEIMEKRFRTPKQFSVAASLEAFFAMINTFLLLLHCQHCRSHFYKSFEQKYEVCILFFIVKKSLGMGFKENLYSFSTLQIFLNHHFDT